MIYTSPNAAIGYSCLGIRYEIQSIYVDHPHHGIPDHEIDLINYLTDDAIDEIMYHIQKEREYERFCVIKCGHCQRDEGTFIECTYNETIIDDGNAPMDFLKGEKNEQDSEKD